MRKFIPFVLALHVATAVAAQTKEVFMFGPMLHLNFGGEKMRISVALELSYWNYENFPYSFDGGLEIEKQKIRLYSEVQTGIGLAGISLGPVLEFRTDEKNLKGGFQTSLWANYFLGFDLRLRRIGKQTYICPGTYVKIPLGIYGDDADGDSDWDWDSSWDRVMKTPSLPPGD